MGGGSSTTKQETTYDPAYMARINANYDRTKSIADQPFQAYTGERVAGFNPTQRVGQQGLLAAANDQTSANGMRSAFDTIQGLLSYKPQAVAPNPISAAPVSASPVTAGLLKDTDLSPYQNPFTQSVIDASLSDLSRARDVQRVADNQTATRESAFGGSRHGVADSLTNDAYLRGVASTAANLRSAGYDKAVEAAIGDINRKYGADTFNSGQRFASDTFNSGQRFASDQFNAGQAFDASKVNASNDITGANMRGNAAQSLASISDQQLRQALQRAGVIQAVGDQEQGLQQLKNDVDYEEFLRMLQDPYQKQALLNSALGAYPVQSTTTATQKSSPGLGGILGGILGIGQTAAGMGWKPFG